MSAGYGAAVLEHFRHPRHRGRLAHADRSAEGASPVCGDRVRIELALDGARIADGRFSGDACALCTASASLLLEHAIGATTAAARALDVADVARWLGGTIPAARRGCARLPIDTLRRALDAAGDSSGGA